jgi:hypothetical protein
MKGSIHTNDTTGHGTARHANVIAIYFRVFKLTCSHLLSVTRYQDVMTTRRTDNLGETFRVRGCLSWSVLFQREQTFLGRVQLKKKINTDLIRSGILRNLYFSVLVFTSTRTGRPEFLATWTRHLAKFTYVWTGTLLQYKFQITNIYKVIQGSSATMFGE